VKPGDASSEPPATAAAADADERDEEISGAQFLCETLIRSLTLEEAPDQKPPRRGPHATAARRPLGKRRGNPPFITPRAKRCRCFRRRLTRVIFPLPVSSVPRYLPRRRLPLGEEDGVCGVGGGEASGIDRRGHGRLQGGDPGAASVPGAPPRQAEGGDRSRWESLHYRPAAILHIYTWSGKRVASRYFRVAIMC